ncbi:hypothetical protein Cme02nite_35060 [Catellatospora methionotrophica]|uniref:Uncharacterized protein n=1 Tax=Catellatospora methionotrophica TaxID=121620 RepID=A0A8J3LGL6_9ACTN|nr:hypothetical protein [Catellatospora methionotrophica]GIG15174.1 hypothetical protein Cme02nite_35060 [Catellatospora methionotrophica]
METTTVRRRAGWLRRSALLLAAIVAAAGAVTFVAPSSAQAATSITYCFEYLKKTPWGWYWVQHCFEVPYAYDPNPCCIFDYGIDLGVNPVLPEEIEAGYLDHVAGGLALLGRARVSDARTAAVLRGQAQEAFLSAARLLRTSRVGVEQVGIADIDKQGFDPQPLPWLSRAATDVADGLSLMQQAVASPSPQPWIRSAMAEFENATTQLAAPQVG